MKKLIVISAKEETSTINIDLSGLPSAAEDVGLRTRLIQGMERYVVDHRLDSRLPCYKWEPTDKGFQVKFHLADKADIELLVNWLDESGAISPKTLGLDADLRWGPISSEVLDAEFGFVVYEVE